MKSSEKKQIGILTWHYYNNFGSVLQTYALHTTIKKLGYNCKVVNYRKCKESYLKTLIKLCLVKLGICINKGYKFLRFRSRELSQTRFLYTRKQLRKATQSIDVLVCGSDQIWAPNVLNTIYMLDFADEHISKISYAASIGLNYIPDELCGTYKELLHDFKSISVREESGVSLLKEKCDTESICVLDPSFLIEKDEWERFTSKRKLLKDYVFCYFLNNNHNYKETVRTYADELNLKIVAVSSNKNDSEWVDVLDECAGPEDFLNYIKNASLIITDSFHGMAFSLIFNKNFYVFERFAVSDEINQNSRIYNLLKKTGLEERIISAGMKARCEENICYEKVNILLEKEKKYSLEYLKEALR